MTSAGSLLRPGSLWPAIVSQTRLALACGALRPIETIQTTIEDGGVRFLIRQVSSLARKDQARQGEAKAGGRRANPFLPWEPELFVAEVSQSHVALLNKFNVIDHHLLLVTRRFEPQEALLGLEDFVALSACLAEFDGLGFYNGGADAGASQPHKHLQVVPLPLAAQGPRVPIEPLLACAPDGTRQAPGLAFAHAFARLDPPPGSSPPEAAAAALDCYRALLEVVGLRAIRVAGEVHQSGPYNLLVTRRWMLVVPRSAECVEGVSINALGFAGSLFVRDEMQLRTIARLGPMTALARVAGNRPGKAPDAE